MKCDDVFEILTRCSFPTGERTDGLVETHLRICHECRHLAEALRPATELFQDALADHSDLPSYRGKLPADSNRPLPDVVESLVRERPLSLFHRPAADGRPVYERILASGLLCIAICALGWSLGVRSATREVSLPTPFTAVTTGPPPSLQVAAAPSQTAQRLDDLRIPIACSVTASTERRYDCCTHCHAAAVADRPRLMSIAELSAACGVCHLASTTGTGDPVIELAF